MEKRLSFRDFQSVKAVAKAIDPKLRERATIQRKAIAFKEEAERQMAALKARLDVKAAKIKEEYDNCQTQIDALEAGILAVTGFHVSDLIKKVIEPTGKTDPNGKPIKDTKYLPTDIVTYDENTKEYVVTYTEAVTPAEEIENPEEEQEEIPEETSEETAEEDLPWEDKD